MKRKTNYIGFKNYQSNERLQNINRAWHYLNPAQKFIVYIRVIWHSTPTLYQIINHIKYYYHRWLTYRLYPAHWIK